MKHHERRCFKDNTNPLCQFLKYTDKNWYCEVTGKNIRNSFKQILYVGCCSFEELRQQAGEQK
jgi:hypothetical protein